MKRQRIEIKSASDLEDIMCDMFTEFLESLVKKKGIKRKPNSDDGYFGQEVSFMYTDKAMIIIDRYRTRMQQLFTKHFPEHDLNLFSTMYMER